MFCVSSFFFSLEIEITETVPSSIGKMTDMDNDTRHSFRQLFQLFFTRNNTLLYFLRVICNAFIRSLCFLTAIRQDILNGRQVKISDKIWLIILPVIQLESGSHGISLTRQNDLVYTLHKTIHA